jgi:hypothetical protein
MPCMLSASSSSDDGVVTMMTSGTRELYRSSNGDQWHLVRETDSGRVLIKHQPNTASGGRTSYVEIAEFLTDGHGPEHQALLRLIGTLVVEPVIAKAERRLAETDKQRARIKADPVREVVRERKRTKEEKSDA